MSSLFEEFQLKDLTLPNRIVMGPMTRAKATPEGVPTPLMALHYAQRASAGLIISEGTWPERRGQGYFDIPGIATQEQEDAWRVVTDAVHAKGGRIFLQSEHTGRVGHEVNNGGLQMVAPSAVPADAMIFTRQSGYSQMTTDLHALTTAETWELIADYYKAAVRTKAAGFDGIELHGASGYLPHQFLSDESNQRTDEFGGTPEKRTEFMIQVLRRLIDAWGTSHRIGVKISPNIRYNGIAENEVEETYSILLERLNDLDLAYVAFQTPESLRTLANQPNDEIVDGEIWHRFPYEFIRERYNGTVIASGDLTKELAQNALDAGKADLFVFGRAYMSNPDLVERMQHDWPINETDLRRGYGGGEEGYTDYPTWEEQRAAAELTPSGA
ncbi:alkene reductase [Microbacterium sp. zg.Y625]|uniref:alkene reductase n=1 Tax=Microbacterium jiangjiandongii TaxID=3049071 RepID=UPI00214B0649|nr:MULTISPECIES: alkene reductase [unclassified Microbacterium]MCR2794120.1 alkene reductase [Microbacterium sp. zg.Y625]WIM25585.1 alkene reductase [Microbacterium sp. zg-Y625]